MNRFLKNVFLVFTFSCVFLLNIVAQSTYSDDFFIPLADKIIIIQKEVQCIYDELLKLDYLPKDPEAGLLLDGKVNKHVLRNGPVLLNLIDWLNTNKKGDPTGILLLRKLNRYLYLQFRHFIGQLKINKKYEGRLVGLLHNIYKFKVPAEIGSVEEKLTYQYPFQATLSKAAMFILIINASELSYDEKIENLAYFLDKVRREFLEIKSHYQDCNIRTSDIADFIEILQTYAAKEPIIGPDYLKYTLITIAVVGVVVFITWITWDKVVRNKIKNAAGTVWDGFTSKSCKLLELFGRHLAKGALDHLGSRDAQDSLEKCLNNLSKEGDVLVRKVLNAVHESDARIVPGVSIVPHRVETHEEASIEVQREVLDESTSGDVSAQASTSLQTAQVGVQQQRVGWLGLMAGWFSSK